LRNNENTLSKLGSLSTGLLQIDTNCELLLIEFITDDCIINQEYTM